MNQTAVISDRTYHLLETISGLDGEKFVLCENENGECFICPLNRWETAAPDPAKRCTQKAHRKKRSLCLWSFFTGGTTYIAMPFSWKGTLAQYVGRLYRNYEG